jgi:hypothetical protein
MASLSNKRLFFLIGLLAITLIYFLYNIFLVDVDYYQSIPRKIRHINKFGSILLVYGVGTWTLKKYTIHWMMQIWHVVYAVTVIALIFIGLYDWRFGVISIQLRNIASALHEFLISPILFVGMGILNSRLLNTPGQ